MQYAKNLVEDLFSNAALAGRFLRRNGKSIALSIAIGGLYLAANFGYNATHTENRAQHAQNHVQNAQETQYIFAQEAAQDAYNSETLEQQAHKNHASPGLDYIFAEEEKYIAEIAGEIASAVMQYLNSELVPQSLIDA